MSKRFAKVTLTLEQLWAIRQALYPAYYEYMMRAQPNTTAEPHAVAFTKVSEAISELEES